MLIYILEDDEQTLEMMTYALQSSDYEVMGFQNAFALYQQLSRRLPALILLDLMLPDEDGLTVLKKTACRSSLSRSAHYYRLGQIHRIGQGMRSGSWRGRLSYQTFWDHGIDQPGQSPAAPCTGDRCTPAPAVLRSAYIKSSYP